MKNDIWLRSNDLDSCLKLNNVQQSSNGYLEVIPASNIGKMMLTTDAQNLNN